MVHIQRSLQAAVIGLSGLSAAGCATQYGPKSFDLPEDTPLVSVEDAPNTSYGKEIAVIGRLTPLGPVERETGGVMFLPQGTEPVEFTLTPVADDAPQFLYELERDGSTITVRSPEQVEEGFYGAVGFVYEEEGAPTLVSHRLFRRD